MAKKFKCTSNDGSVLIAKKLQLEKSSMLSIKENNGRSTIILSKKDTKKLVKLLKKQDNYEL
jgi:hypothetical protein